jgi:hypothetical protein
MEPQFQYPKILEKELKDELAKIDQDIALLRLKSENINSRYDVLRRQSQIRELSATDRDFMLGAWQDGGRYATDIAKLEKRKENITTQKKQVVERDAKILFEQARDVEARTGKNKLYIGSRQFVALHAESKKNKANAKRQILNANNWTWGVNFAWIEGGTTAAARIKIKENEKNPNPFETIPDGAYDEMLIRPRMSGKDWLALCREYPNTILWHGGENRPTWTALEIEACLNAGYQFAFRDHKHGDEGRVIELVRR